MSFQSERAFVRNPRTLRLQVAVSVVIVLGGLWMVVNAHDVDLIIDGLPLGLTVALGLYVLLTGVVRLARMTRALFQIAPAVTLTRDGIRSFLSRRWWQRPRRFLGWHELRALKTGRRLGWQVYVLHGRDGPPMEIPLAWLRPAERVEFERLIRSALDE